MEPFVREDFLVRNEGLVTWETPAKFQIYTESSLRHWPVDSRTCILFMGSYRERNYKIISGNDTFIAPAMMNMQNNQWKITETSTSLQTSPFIGQYVRYKLNLQRQSSVLIVMVACSVMLSVVLTFIPFGMTVLADRLKVHGLQAILSTVYITYFLSIFTTSTLETPLVGECVFKRAQSRYFSNIVIMFSTGFVTFECGNIRTLNIRKVPRISTKITMITGNLECCFAVSVTFFSRIFGLNAISMALSILEWNLVNLRHIKVPSIIQRCMNGRYFRMLRDVSI